MKKAIGTAAGALGALAARDLLQRRHSVLRNYPALGHMRYLMEAIRPELQQYFIERDYDGRPFDRDTRSVIYQRAKGIEGEQSFGTQRDVNRVGYEHLVHSAAPCDPPEDPPRVRIGGPDCTRPYEMSLMNISAMSFGALSANAIRALNKGAAMGGFAHDTGEGGLSDHHLAHGGDLVWELGTGYFSARTGDGRLDRGDFARKAAAPQVKMISLKLSQGAKPGLGGVLPAAKVSEEIARIRQVPAHETCVSPPGHREFDTPRGLIRFIAELRRLADGKPVGFKLCVGSRLDVMAICRAILEEGTAPDFIIVDGSEGGTAAAPLEWEDHMGMPLRDGLITVHNCLVGAGLREQVKVGASGKVAAANDIVKRLIQGADFTNSARSMMMAVGCIQARRCQTGKCPTGVATQSAWRQRALDVPEKAKRTHRYHEATVRQATRMMASMGARTPRDLNPTMLRMVVEPGVTRSYAELYRWLEPGCLVDGTAPEEWAADWRLADADSFTPRPFHRGAGHDSPGAAAAG